MHFIVCIHESKSLRMIWIFILAKHFARAEEYLNWKFTINILARTCESRNAHVENAKCMHNAYKQHMPISILPSSIFSVLLWSSVSSNSRNVRKEQAKLFGIVVLKRSSSHLQKNIYIYIPYCIWISWYDARICNNLLLVHILYETMHDVCRQ